MKKQSASAVSRHSRCVRMRLKPLAAALLSLGLVSLGAQAAPQGGVVRAGDAQVVGGGAVTRVEQQSARAVIDWRSFGIGAAEQVQFLQPSTHAATLNRVTGEQASVILGRMDANGQVLLINPYGIVFGRGAQVNVGSLIASTSNISNSNFMAGRLVFDQPGKPGAGILNAGTITAAEGGLVTLVAPHVRNDGLIQARLGKVILGAADTFTIDLYGDGLVNLALSDIHAGQLRDVNGQPVSSLITHTGQIDVAGGQAVLITAANAKNVLDNLINMSGTIKADAAVQQGGRILLLGEGGTVGVSGTLSAQGATGGQIQVLGDQVHVASPALLDASGALGGGVIHVGGAYQGTGDAYRAQQTVVDAGAILRANATDRGNGGEVVVWSDGQTAFAGAVEAKGGANGGDGGRMEISGKGTLDFNGSADASAPRGSAGSLLLDPAYLNIGLTESALIGRVLRTGTSTTLAADIDINVNSVINGGGRYAGGGLTMSAGNNINLNDFVVTNNGAISLFANAGTVNILSGKAVFAGGAPITVQSGGTLHTGPLITSGALTLASTAGNVAIDSFIDGGTGAVRISAAGDVGINQPIVNLVTGNPLNVTAGNDINVNAQVDGRGGVAGGGVALTAARNVSVNNFIVTNNGAINVTATNGTAGVASGKGLFAGTAPIVMNAKGDITTGMSSSGALTLASSAGAVAVNGLIDGATTAASISAATDVNVNQPIVNLQSGSALNVTAGNDINVNAQIDGRGGVAGGAVTLTASRNLNVNDFIVTNNGAVALTATNGVASVAAGKGLFTGTAPIAVNAKGNVTTGVISGGSLAATSTTGSVTVNGVIDGSTGRVDLSAGTDVNINQPVLNLRTGTPLNVTAGNDIITAAKDIILNVDGQIDGRGGVAGGAVTLTANRNLNLNNFIVTNNGAINLIATNGTTSVAAGKELFAGTAPIAMNAKGNITTGMSSSGALTLTSSAGAVAVNGLIDGATGAANISAATDVNINQAALNLRTGNPLNVTAGNDINVNAPLDGRDGVAGGAVTLTASRNLNVNDFIVTNNGAISLTATNGTTSVAAGKGLFAGTAPISMTSGATLNTGILSTTGALNIRSTAGVVNINQPIANTASTSPLTVSAGTNINLNAQIDGRDANAATPSGTVTMTAGQNINLNENIVTENASIGLTAQNGTMTIAAGKGLFSGLAPISMNAKGNITTGMSSSGALTVTSGTGSVALNGVIDISTGVVNVSAGTDVSINQPVLNLRAGNPFNVTAGNDINVNVPLDGRGGVAGGAVTLTASRNLNVNDFIGTNNGVISLTATNGTMSVAAGKGLFAGTAPISINAKGNVTADVMSGGTISVASSAGAVALNGPVSGNGGPISISAAGAVDINQAIANPASTSPLTISAGTNINLNAQIDGRDLNPASPSGMVTMTAGQNINLNQSVVSENASIGLTAQNGTVTTAAGKGLFAGSGPIAVTSGGTLSTGILTTTGSLTLRSTAGSLNVDTPIDGTTGAVTLTAAGAVNVNQPIANPRSDAPLTANAGTNINVNAAIDGRDLNAASSSGKVMMTAGQNINLNQSMVSENAEITLTAQSGTITTAASKGLFAGNAPISVTSGATLNTGILSTTGALNIRSTASAVNVSTPIDDTTGAVTINAATAVNVNQTITNIKTGSPLSITAGTDLNVNAQIDGRNGTAAGGTVTLTAGNNLRLFDNIATNNGAINLTSINGSVFLAPVSQDANLLILATPKQVLAGNAPITIVSGGDFSNGAPPPQPIPTPDASVVTAQDAKDYVRNFLKQYVQLVTTGPLNITSTNGNVNVDAPISDLTGPVTITAGNTINVKHKVNSDNQPITLNGGTGGINIFAVNDGCGGLCFTTTPLDARAADLTLNSIGDVSATGGVATSKTLTIDTRGNLTGGVGQSSNGGLPSKIVLIADQGIPGFGAFTHGDVSATSIGGSISLGVEFPSKLRITTGTPDPNNPTAATDCTNCNIGTGGFIGPDVVLNAGGTVNLSNSVSLFGGTVSLIARAGDVNLEQTNVAKMLTISAGRDVKLNASGCSSTGFSGDYCGVVWVGPQNSSPASGPFSVTAGRDIITDAYSPIHISNAQALTLVSGDRVAGGDVTLNLLETLGSVNITAKTGNITLIQPVGPQIINPPPSSDAFPNQGVASLLLSAPQGSIGMAGARAVGAISIVRGTTLTTSRDITGGSLSIKDAQGNDVTGAFVNPGVAIGTQNQLVYPGFVLPAIPPGPTVPPPAAPGFAGAPAPGFPLLLEIAVADQPGSVGTVAQPGATGGAIALPGSPGGATAPGVTGETVALPGSSGGATAPGATGGTVALPGSPGGATVPGATGAVVALSGVPLGASFTAPAGSSDEGTVDTASAQRAAQQTSTAASAAGDDTTLIALASSDSDVAGQQTVLCPAGVAPGSSLQRKDAAGKAVTVTCK